MIAALVMAFVLNSASLAEDPMRFPRVREAFARKEETLKVVFAEKKIPFPPARLFLRALKAERILELWAAGPEGPFALAKEFPICNFSGGPGPKRREGDAQVPEGFYHIARFNPQSRFLLSLGLSYPNASDRILGARGRLGGDIFIHGNCVSIGCLAMTDDLIREIYAAAVLARAAGQKNIPVHVFPTRLNEAGLARLEKAKPELSTFWRDLKVGYDLFEKFRLPPEPRVDAKGRYVF